MTPSAPRIRLIATLLVAASLIAVDADAQRARNMPPVAPTAPAYDPALYSSPTATSANFKSLRWRLVGPFRGGRAVAVAGDLAKPFLFYMGSVNGGVWRTTNGGQTWENLTDGKTRHLVGGRDRGGAERCRT